MQAPLSYFQGRFYLLDFFYSLVTCCGFPCAEEVLEK